MELSITWILLALGLGFGVALVGIAVDSNGRIQQANLSMVRQWVYNA